MTGLEVVAALFAILCLTKIIFVVVRPKAWLNRVVKPIYGSPKVSATVVIVLALIIFIILMPTLSIVHMFAVFALLSLLICVGLLLTAKDLLPLATKMYKYPLTGVRVIYALFWAILSIWVLVEVFT